ncbi:MAG: nucleoside hydrolase, partial [Actinomycetota bacterium]
ANHDDVELPLQAPGHGATVLLLCTSDAVAGRPRLIIDCDPGHDDALALVVAGCFADLVGVTTVAGNAPVTHTTRNARIMLDLIGSAAPLHRGAERPLVAPPRHAPEVHGESGLDGAVLPAPSRPEDSRDAVGYIIDTCRAEEGLWLVPIGPLTNIALALRAAPDLVGRIAGISLMGGGTFGNRTPAAEFNVWADPEAAAIVFGYGGRLIMSGLDVTHQLQATPERIARVRQVEGQLAAIVADLFDYFLSTYVPLHENLRGGVVHDACAVMALTHPHLFVARDHHVVVETSGEFTAGMTLIDLRGHRRKSPPNCTVQWEVDSEAAFGVILEAVTAFSH